MKSESVIAACWVLFITGAVYLLLAPSSPPNCDSIIEYHEYKVIRGFHTGVTGVAVYLFNSEVTLTVPTKNWNRTITVKCLDLEEVIK